MSDTSVGFREFSPEAGFEHSESSGVLILACGALAREILALQDQLSADGGNRCDVRCLPARLHNTPEKIPGLLRAKLERHHREYRKIFVAYADCGTGGLIDQVLGDFPNVERLEGPHCYASYSGQDDFAGLMEEELGSFFLTDYMVRFFDQLIIRGMGLDRFPQLREAYFGHYRRVVYLAQTDDPALQVQAKKAADILGLAYEYRFTGMGELGQFVALAHGSMDGNGSE